MICPYFLASDKIPIIILFGPPHFGKTFTLIRLSIYLLEKGYEIQPVRDFINDNRYAHICDSYIDCIYRCFDEDISLVSLLQEWPLFLLEISKNGKPLCKLLKISGWFCFNPYMTMHQGDVPILDDLFQSSNKIVLMPFLELEWSDHIVRQRYVSRLHQLFLMRKQTDKTIFLLNKIDRTSYVIQPGKVLMKLVLRDIEYEYPNIFFPFKIKNPIIRLWRGHNCRIVPFQTGTFATTTTKDGLEREVFLQSSDEYPQKLWKEIMKSLI